MFCLNRIGLVVGLGVFLAGVNPAAGQMRGPIQDERIIQEARLVARGEHVAVYQHQMEIDSAFLGLAEEAYRQLEESLGTKLDTATLGPKIRIYISNLRSVCHVWKGPNHPRDPKGIIFLNQQSYRGAMQGVNANYIHEMTHLFTWRYRSHTLREGLAEYMAMKILPAGIRQSPASYEGTVPADVIEHLGTTTPPPRWMFTDPSRRWVYYAASYRLVKYLIEKKGMETFRKLYESDSPETAIRRLYGLSREEAIQAAGMP
jgi:hypothetical protein